MKSSSQYPGTTPGKTKTKLSLTKKKLLIIIPCAVVGLFLFLTLVCGFTTVKSGYKGVRVVLGKAQEEIVEEGLVGKFWLTTKIEKVDVRIRKLELVTANASKDLQDVKTTIVVNYRVKADQVVELYRNAGLAYEQILVTPAVIEVQKSVVAQYTAEELITKRNEAGVKTMEALRTKFEGRYIEITDFAITNFEFSEAFNKAIEEKQIAEQNALKAQYELDRIILEAKQEIEKSKAEAEKVKLLAQAEADKIRIKSVEVANMLGIPTKEITRTTGKDEEGNPITETITIVDETNLTDVQREQMTEYLKFIEYLSVWDGKLPDVVGGDNSIIVPKP